MTGPNLLFNIIHHWNINVLLEDPLKESRIDTTLQCVTGRQRSKIHPLVHYYWKKKKQTVVPNDLCVRT